MTEHTILVALTVEASTRLGAHALVQASLPRPGGVITSWWIAEDDRIDSSDCDSAVFVHPSAQDEAFKVLLAAGLTADWNRPARIGGQFSGTYDRG